MSKAEEPVVINGVILNPDEEVYDAAEFENDAGAEDGEELTFDNEGTDDSPAEDAGTDKSAEDEGDQKEVDGDE